VVSRSNGYQSGASPEACRLAPFIEELSISETMVLQTIVAKVFSCPKRFGFSSGDEAAEAFIRYKARLRSIIQKSREISGNREAYIDSCIRFLARSVQRSLRKKEMLDIVLETSGEMAGLTGSPSLSPAPAQEPADGEALRFIANIAPSCFIARMNAEGKRLLYLVVKCAWEVDDSIAEKSARRLGVPVLWLCSLLHQASPPRTLQALPFSLNEKITPLGETRMIEAMLRETTWGRNGKPSSCAARPFAGLATNPFSKGSRGARLLVPNRLSPNSCGFRKDRWTPAFSISRQIFGESLKSDDPQDILQR